MHSLHDTACSIFVKQSVNIGITIFYMMKKHSVIRNKFNPQRTNMKTTWIHKWSFSQLTRKQTLHKIHQVIYCTAIWCSYDQKNQHIILSKNSCDDKTFFYHTNLIFFSPLQYCWISLLYPKLTVPLSS